MRAWADENDVKRILIPIEFIHTRRLRWALDKVFKDSKTEVSVYSIEPNGYSRESWWTNEQGLIGVQTEIIKYFFYRFKY